MAKSIQLSDSDGNVYVTPNTETIDAKISGGWSSGVVGTRVAQWNYTIPSGKTPIACSITYVANSSKYIPIALLSSGVLYLNYYATQTGAVSESDTACSITVIYK